MMFETNREKTNYPATIDSLNISRIEKNILYVCVKPKRIAEIAVATELTYAAACQRILILEARGYLNKGKTMQNFNVYIINEQKVKNPLKEQQKAIRDLMVEKTPEVVKKDETEDLYFNENTQVN